jgi:hypothetical protein
MKKTNKKQNSKILVSPKITQKNKIHRYFKKLFIYLFIYYYYFDYSGKNIGRWVIKNTKFPINFATQSAIKFAFL